MESDKPLTRDALLSMQVIDARGRLVGKVKDVAFAIGRMGVSLAVEDNMGQVKNIGWEEVQAASDFIVLKPAVQQQPAQQYSQPQPTYQQQPIQQQPVITAQAQPVAHIQQPVQQPVIQQPTQQRQSSQPLCQKCGKPLTWIPQYSRWYCYNDKKYA